MHGRNIQAIRARRRSHSASPGPRLSESTSKSVPNGYCVEPGAESRFVLGIVGLDLIQSFPETHRAETENG